MLTKIIRGYPGRPVRWKDEKGNSPGLRRILCNGSRAAFTGVGRILFGKRPPIPWISYDAVIVLERHLNRKSAVLEFGSGMSTAWYANRAGVVHSVEDNKKWYDVVKEKLAALKIDNVELGFAGSESEYATYGKKMNQLYDLIMVDGSIRSECVLHSLDLIAPGGIFYLDNSDKHSNGAGGDTRIAEELLLKAAKEKSATVTYYTDFCPTQFFAEQGMMVTFPKVVSSV